MGPNRCQKREASIYSTDPKSRTVDWVQHGNSELFPHPSEAQILESARRLPNAENKPSV